MKRNRELESRLVEWGKEYGGGKYSEVGPVTSWLGQMVKWGGRAPTGLGHIPLGTGADEVQEAIEALAVQGEHGELPALIIRCEYLTPGQPLIMKQQRLRKIGWNVERVRYYQYLRTARIHVAAWIHLPYLELEEDAA